jgi:hypothetical protein
LPTPTISWQTAPISRSTILTSWRTASIDWTPTILWLGYRSSPGLKM